MAKRQKTLVQCLGDLVKSTAADVMMVGRRHNRDGEAHGAKYRRRSWAKPRLVDMDRGTSALRPLPA